MENKLYDYMVKSSDILDASMGRGNYKVGFLSPMEIDGQIKSTSLIDG